MNDEIYIISRYSSCDDDEINFEWAEDETTARERVKSLNLQSARQPCESCGQTDTFSCHSLVKTR